MVIRHDNIFIGLIFIAIYGIRTSHISLGWNITDKKYLFHFFISNKRGLFNTLKVILSGDVLILLHWKEFSQSHFAQELELI